MEIYPKIKETYKEIYPKVLELTPPNENEIIPGGYAPPGPPNLNWRASPPDPPVGS